MLTVYAQNREEWRDWLLVNHRQATEVYLIYYKKGSGKATISYEESVEEALCFGWIDGIRKPRDGESYMNRFSPRKTDSIWSQINQVRVEKMVSEGRMTEAGMKTVEVAKRNGQWDAAYTMQGPQQLPADFRTALEVNPLAYENFQKFSNSVQFTFIRMVDKIKGAALRAEKIRKAVALCALNQPPYGPDRKPRF